MGMLESGRGLADFGAAREEFGDAALQNEIFRMWCEDEPEFMSLFLLEQLDTPPESLADLVSDHSAPEAARSYAFFALSSRFPEAAIKMLESLPDDEQAAMIHSMRVLRALFTAGASEGVLAAYMQTDPADVEAMDELFDAVASAFASDVGGVRGVWARELIVAAHDFFLPPYSLLPEEVVEILLDIFPATLEIESPEELDEIIPEIRAFYAWLKGQAEVDAFDEIDALLTDLQSDYSLLFLQRLQELLRHASRARSVKARAKTKSKASMAKASRKKNRRRK